ncbi:hypothetical protein H7F15_06200 [Pontibacter sp. Tf4]|uniref:hypothetical protein n=1 Tax=Pontibacter sp. Tf4 TaxID=2761620 RepID=UPI001623EFA1|nr:hypothetical protein [Pontibacter sp. Tf4]MBB6610620.1 hypothetical protein [Pontibacter sp. Tf4]
MKKFKIVELIYGTANGPNYKAVQEDTYGYLKIIEPINYSERAEAAEKINMLLSTQRSEFKVYTIIEVYS